ncbi:MAG: M6 family metalloprotease domain-containing protein [Deltaproteobacteria bacterium]|nr:MAG: M6 family metalloprotease domain-containing protein [Deltaproteobacteria bacterium]
MTARSSLLRRSIPGARPARRTSSVVAALAALAPRLVRLAHHDCPDRLLALALVALALAGTARAAAADPPRPPRELRLLVVLAGFPDRPLAKTPAHFARQLSRFVAYWTEVSSGRLRLVPTLDELAVTLPGPRRSYVQRPDALARDALAALAAVPAAADALIVFFAGTGRESHPDKGPADDPWSNYTALVPPARAGGVAFEAACVIAEKEVRPLSSFGVLCHEFGHLLGLPELYAPGGHAQEGIGVWGLMGQGTWLGRGERPPHLCAWSKLRLGWVEVETIARSTRGVTLPQVEREPRVVKIPAAPAHPEEYYLLENRARVGADRRLPGEGLLVWHVDERALAFRSAETDVERKLLGLVEADGRGDLDRGHAAGGNRGDATDPWSGPPPWRRRASAALLLLGACLVAAAVLRAARPRPLVPALGRLAVAAVALAAGALLGRAQACGPGTPGMAPHDGGPTRVVLRNLSPAGPVMHLDVLVAPPAGD